MSLPAHPTPSRPSPTSTPFEKVLTTLSPYVTSSSSTGYSLTEYVIKTKRVQPQRTSLQLADRIDRLHPQNRLDAILSYCLAHVTQSPKICSLLYALTAALNESRDYPSSRDLYNFFLTHYDNLVSKYLPWPPPLLIDTPHHIRPFPSCAHQRNTDLFIDAITSKTLTVVQNSLKEFRIIIHLPFTRYSMHDISFHEFATLSVSFRLLFGHNSHLMMPSTTNFGTLESISDFVRLIDMLLAPRNCIASPQSPISISHLTHRLRPDATFPPHWLSTLHVLRFSLHSWLPLTIVSSTAEYDDLPSKHRRPHIMVRNSTISQEFRDAQEYVHNVTYSVFFSLDYVTKHLQRTHKLLETPNARNDPRSLIRRTALKNLLRLPTELFQHVLEHDISTAFPACECFLNGYAVCYHVSTTRDRLARRHSDCLVQSLLAVRAHSAPKRSKLIYEYIIQCTVFSQALQGQLTETDYILENQSPYRYMWISPSTTPSQPLPPLPTFGPDISPQLADNYQYDFEYSRILENSRTSCFPRTHAK